MPVSVWQCGGPGGLACKCPNWIKSTMGNLFLPLYCASFVSTINTTCILCNLRHKGKQSSCHRARRDRSTSQILRLWDTCGGSDFLLPRTKFYWFWCILKGKLGKTILSAQSFYHTLTKRSRNRQFSPKSPEVGEKSGQRVQNWPNKNQKANSYCRNPLNSGQQLL